MKLKEDKYGYVHRKQYEQALARIELLEGKVKELYARMNVLFTIYNKVDAVGKEIDKTRDKKCVSFILQGVHQIPDQYQDVDPDQCE